VIAFLVDWSLNLCLLANFVVSTFWAVNSVGLARETDWSPRLRLVWWRPRRRVRVPTFALLDPPLPWRWWVAWWMTGKAMFFAVLDLSIALGGGIHSDGSPAWLVNTILWPTLFFTVGHVGAYLRWRRLPKWGPSERLGVR
jgi:hypothetical protein